MTPAMEAAGSGAEALAGRPFRHGGMIRAIRCIDAVGDWSGRLISFLILPMVASLVFEIVARYFFTAPTIWANDLSTILYGIFWMTGSAYALKEQLHIRTDFLYQNWSVRTQGIIDALLYLLLYFPALLIFLWIGGEYAWRSVRFGERIISSPWMPIIWPVKLAIPVSTVLLLVQGISELLKSLYAASTGTTLQEHRADTEV